MKHCKTILIATLLSAATFSAHALETTITFDDQPLGSGSATDPNAFNSLTIEDVTFNGSDSSGNPANFYFTHLGNIPSDLYLANGSVGFTSLTFSFNNAISVSEFSFTLGSSVNAWTLDAFDTSGNAIASTVAIEQDRIGDNSFGFTYAEGISYATLTQVGPGPLQAFTGQPADLIGLDDLTYTYTDTVSAVPEPSTYALMLGGLGLVGFMAYRRQKTTNA